MLNNLPNELLYKILDFLNEKDYIRFSLVNKKIRNIVINNINKKGFIILYHDNFDIFLTHINEFSLPLHLFELKLYNNNIEMTNDYEYILSTDENVNIDCEDKNLILINNNKTININVFKNIYSISFSQIRITEKNFSKIFNKNNIKKFIIYDNYFNINYFKNVEYLDISNNNFISDISILENVKELILYGCPNITEINNLKNIEILDINRCENIKNINNLTKLKKLILNRININDISNLGNVKDLKINYCHNINDISMLNNVKKLNLSYSKFNISYINNIWNVISLDLSDTDIKDIELIKIFEASKKSLKILKLIQCKLITDKSLIQIPECITDLDLCLTNISDISFLNNITKIKILNINSCKKIIDFQPLLLLKKLVILDISYTNIKDISKLRKKIKILHFSGCNIIKY